MADYAMVLARRALMVSLVWFGFGSVSWAKPVVKCEQSSKATAYVSGQPSDIIVVPFNGVPVSIQLDGAALGNPLGRATGGAGGMNARQPNSWK